MELTFSTNLKSSKGKTLAIFLLLGTVLAGVVRSQSAQSSNQSPNQSGPQPTSPAPQSTVSGAPPPATSGANPATAAAPAPAPAGSSAPVPAGSSAPNPSAPLLSPVMAAQELYRSRKFGPAADAYNVIIATTGPDVAAGYAGLARVYLKQSKVADAYVAAQKAVATDEHLPAAHAALGEVYFRQGNFGDAEREFWVPLKEKHPDARAYFGVYRLYLATSNYKMAKTALQLAHQLDPQDPEIREHWVYTLGLKERVKALQDDLATPGNRDEETLKDMGSEVVFLNDRLKRSELGCHLVNKITSTQTELEQLIIDANNIRGYGLKVKLNDTTARLLLDTGASGILVNSKIAEKAGIQRVAEQKMGGVGDKGEADGYIGYAESIQIGELQFQNCYVDVLDKKRATGEEGLIGADVFSHFLVDIDFPNHKLKLTELPKRPDEPTETATLDRGQLWTDHPHDRYIAPEMKSYTKLFRFGHFLLIPTSINDHPPKLFFIDTGAFDNTITPAAAREYTKVSAEYGVKVKGISGEVRKMYTADDVSLGFANLRQQHKTIFAFDFHLDDSLGTEISGALGFGTLFLLDIKIDYRDGLVDFSYDDNRLH